MSLLLDCLSFLSLFHAHGSDTPNANSVPQCFAESLLPEIHTDFLSHLESWFLRPQEITELEQHVIAHVLYLTLYMKQSQLKNSTSSTKNMILEDCLISSLSSVFLHFFLHFYSYTVSTSWEHTDITYSIFSFLTLIQS